MAHEGLIKVSSLFVFTIIPRLCYAAPDTRPDLFEDDEKSAVSVDQPKDVHWTPSMMGVFSPELHQVLRSAATQPLPERINIVSQHFLKRPYAIDPLGEGKAPDVDPLTRYDVFDCLTYVEEVLALSHSGSPHLAAKNRMSLRYGATDSPLYPLRNHFMELQWIPDAIQSGWLLDITPTFEGAFQRTKEVQASTWKDWRPARNFPMTLDRFPTGSMDLHIIPVDAMLKQMKQIPNGSIILIVRVDKPPKPIWVSHIGFVFQNPKTVIRHASKLGGGSVRENSLHWYLSHLKGYKYWPAAGVAILKPVEFGPRLSRLETE